MVLAHPFWLLLLPLLLLPWVGLRRKGFVGYSDNSLARGIPAGAMLYRLPLLLISLAFVLLVVALARPQRLHVQSSEADRARDIIVAVDISGSMGSPFAGEIPQRERRDPELDKELPVGPPRRGMSGGELQSAPDNHRRIDAAQGAVIRFVEDRYLARAGDRIGIEVFDMSPHWSWPLTHDLRQIYRKGQFVDQGLGGGTNFGEFKPGPIDAAAEHFDEMGKSKTKVLIMVTDGEDNLSAATIDRLADVLQSRGIHFYLIGVGETLATRDVDIMRLAERVGGSVFRVENAQDLARCFDGINQMERSVIEVQSSVQHEELFFYFAAVAIFLFALGMIAEALITSQ